jgi:hypothetical protein
MTTPRLKMISLASANRFYIPAQPDAAQQAKKLLWHVNRADYDEIKKLCTENISYMFLDVVDQKGVVTTPLKQAIHLLDTRIYKMFYDAVKADPIKQREFIKQLEEQQATVDLSPLLEGYKEYIDYMNFCINLFNIRLNQISNFNFASEVMALRNANNTDSVNQRWLELAKLQHDTLPMHMIREFCRNNVNFCDYQFDASLSLAPKGGEVHFLASSPYPYPLTIPGEIRVISIDTPEFRSEFGKTFGLLRGDSTCWYLCGHYTDEQRKELYYQHPWARSGGNVGSAISGFMDYFKDSVHRDAAVFNRLLKTRKQELTFFRTELKDVAELNAMAEVGQRPHM